MFSAINLTIFFLWLLSALVDYSEFCYLWQLKEYRWDRFRDFLSTKQGKKYWSRYPLLWRSLLAIIIFFWPINEILTIKYLVLSIFLIDFAYNLYRAWKRKIKRPIFTKKALLIIFSTPIIEGLLFVVSRDWTALLLLLILRFLLISIVIIILSLPTKLLKKYYVKKAAEKLSEYKNLTVIGITGSYGKSTTKTFLAHILSRKFRVLKTPKNINTEIGVANFILKHNFNDADIFIVEMGAYRQGEIKLICDMVKPMIGILTAINEQHLSLFGDIKITQQTKYELLRSLPKDGLVVTNADNPLCTEFLPELKVKAQTFGLKEENKPDCLITDITNRLDSISCTFIVRDEECKIESPIIGAHNAMNIAPCFLAGKFLGLSCQDVQEQCITLKLPKGLLEFYTYGRCQVLDDSYNSNPNGFQAVSDVINKFPSEKKRVVITRGMIELGERSEEIHKKIAEEIALVADELVIISRDFVEPMEEAIKKVGGKYRTNIVFKFHRNELLDYVRSLKNTDCIVLLENRIPSNVYEELTGSNRHPE